MLKSKNNFDSFASSYQKELNQAIPMGFGEAKKFTRIKVMNLRRRIEKIFGNEKNLALLDAGCGVGLTDELLKPFYPNLAGFDISSESIKLAKERNPEIQYKLSDGIRIPFCDQAFDLVFAICVLHHIPPTERLVFFNEIHRVLRPKGAFFIYEHNPWNPLTRLIVSRCAFDQNAFLLSFTETRQLLRKSGFIPNQSGSLIFLPTENSAWQRFEESFFAKLPLGAQYFESGIKTS